MGLDINEISENAMGGTELMLNRLKTIQPDLLDKVQIIFSRVRELDETRHRIFFAHDLPEDPEAQHLLNNGWNKFHKIVFVSHTQRNEYLQRFNIPYSRTVVLQNAITPIEVHTKPTDKLNLIYHTTPHRGLAILIPVFEKLAETDPNIHLNVYSSFNLYGWGERDVPFEPLFQKIKDHPQMTYHGSVSNDEIRSALKENHIFAYPCTWEETSCLSLMEAMSAGCVSVHPNYGALPETSANWSVMYNFHEDINQHANIFYGVLDQTIKSYRDDRFAANIHGGKIYSDLFYNWSYRKSQWEALLQNVIQDPLDIPKIEEMFVVNTR